MFKWKSASNLRTIVWPTSMHASDRCRAGLEGIYHVGNKLACYDDPIHLLEVFSLFSPNYGFSLWPRICMACILGNVFHILGLIMWYWSYIHSDSLCINNITKWRTLDNPNILISWLLQLNMDFWLYFIFSFHSSRPCSVVALCPLQFSLCGPNLICSNSFHVQVAELAEPTSPELQETVYSVVHGLLATLAPKMHSKAPLQSENPTFGTLNLGKEDSAELLENTSLQFQPLILVTRDYLARLLFWFVLKLCISLPFITKTSIAPGSWHYPLWSGLGLTIIKDSCFQAWFVNGPNLGLTRPYSWPICAIIIIIIIMASFIKWLGLGDQSTSEWADPSPLPPLFMGNNCWVLNN